ncbi:forkhead box protein N1 [Aulostomus maculatus]
MSDSPTFSPSRGKSPTSTPQANLHNSRTSCQQMAQSQTKDGSDICFTLQESNTFSLRAAAVNRRHSVDGSVTSGSGQGLIDPDRFHPYLRQSSDGAVAVGGGLRHSSSPFGCLQDVCSPDTSSVTQSTSTKAPTTWEQYNGSIQCSYPDPPAVAREPSYFHSHSYPPYSSSSPLQQVSPRMYPTNEQSNSSKYSLESFSIQPHQRSPSQSIFPKPIYSYSILIFMALKNSKTGSLPVSEIYSFMTEHFPYFKTAPDGWKNSVRHNLSLNKCFEKVENKNGTSSRKGCLWALNPAKVEKMQEELHKWRRKDPITVRRSMARPEDLERLLGEKPNKLKSLPSNTALFSRAGPTYGTTSTCYTPTQLRPPSQTSWRPQYLNIPPPSQQSCFLPTAHPSNSFALYPPAAGIPSENSSLNSPTAGKMPPAYNAALQAECSVGPQSIQDLLLEGEASYDVDTLNPSLTDLQLQGNLWDELREDSLASESQAVTTTTQSTTFALQDSHVHATLPVNQAPEVAVIGRCKIEDAGRGQSFEQHGCFNGFYPGVYSGMDSLAGYLTCCTASISLI